MNLAKFFMSHPEIQKIELTFDKDSKHIDISYHLKSGFNESKVLVIANDDMVALENFLIERKRA